MNIREINKPVTAKRLNESLAKKFGKSIDIESFTLEQLQDARNRLRTKMSQVETMESFDAPQSASFQKTKLFLDVLNAAIAERENITDSSMTESIVNEGEEDKAELVMAAKDMVDKVTSWMEDTAQMQTESMLELADAIRDEMGQEAADAFTNSVKPALESLYQAMEATRTSLTGGVGQLTGEAPPTDMMGADDDMEMDPTLDGSDDMDMDMDAEVPMDDFGADGVSAGGEEEAGRAKRESRMYAKRAMLEQSRRLASILSKKK